MIDIIGFLSALCFTLSALPQVVLVVKQKHACGVSSGTIIMLISGSLGMLVYLVLSGILNPILLLDFCVTFLVWSTIGFYKIKGRK